MNIISYNVNGIRAAINKGFVDWLKRESPDVICLQEIKANKEQVDVSEIENLGYNTFWFSAQKRVIVALQYFQNKNLIMLNMDQE